MKKAVGSAVALAILLAGCSSKTDPNEKNFGAAIANYLDVRGEQCLGNETWPVEVNAFDRSLQKTIPQGKAGNMAALEAVGLVKGTEVEKTSIGILGKPIGTYKVTSYALTPASLPYQREVRAGGVVDGKPVDPVIDLCWGRKVFVEVVKWEGPIKLGDYQEATVQYRYKIDSIADWATKPEVQKGFPMIASIIEGAATKPGQHAVKLTSEGWEAKGLDSAVIVNSRAKAY